MAHVSHHHVPERHPPGAQRRWQARKHWEDWTNMVLGLLLVASPWLLRFTGLEAVTLNAVVIGGLVFALSALALTLLDRWEAYISGLLGIWAILSPWLIGFSNYDAATAAHIGLGALVVVIAAIEIWQDGRA
jgi:hypothetical protein